MSLGFVPTPIAGELLYSLMARWRTELGTNRQATVRAWFGNEAVVRLVSFPPLELIRDRLPPRGEIGVEALEAHHTLYPFGGAFRDRRKWVDERGALLTGRRQGGARGARALNRKAPLLFCPECGTSDLVQLGQPTWRREHQLDGAVVCAEHGCGLRMDPSFSKSCLQPLRPPPFDLAGDIVVDPFPPGASLALARTLRDLCVDRPRQDHDGALTARLRFLLVTTGYLRMRSARPSDRLESDLGRFFGREGLERLGLQPRDGTFGGWVNKTLASSRFGRVNPTAISLILAMTGAAWVDPDAAAHVSPPQVRRTERGTADTELRKLPRYKATITALLAASPGLSRTDLRAGSGCAMWKLGCLDPGWLASVIPPKKERGVQVQGVAYETDEAALAHLNAAIAEQVAGNVKPARMSSHWLRGQAGLLGCGLRRRDVKLFPITCGRIVAMSESMAVFRRRQVVWAAKKLKAEGSKPSLPRFRTIAFGSGSWGAIEETLVAEAYEGLMVS